jgi:YgiT-type zinc finger domain-containing protein
MKCVICKKGETEAGTATVTLDKDRATLVFKGVPARVCANCGEEYVDENITASLLRSAAEAAQSGIQVEVRQYTAA